MSHPATAAVGRTRVRRDILVPWPSQAMLGLLDRDQDALTGGDPLPLGWHWFYFREPRPAAALAADGHEERGGFMPKVDLPRRMWAGGTLRSLRPVLLGEMAELRSEVRDVKEKQGKSGRLVFVTVGQTVLQDGRECVEEEQTIAYREAAPGQAAEVGSPAGPDQSKRTSELSAAWTETFLPTTVTLFQFSALTWNAHRIHYDHLYATGQEGYPGLLVHGPLTALLLLAAADRHAPASPSSFRYRALAPLYVNQPITLVGRSGAPPFPGDAGGPSRGDADTAPRVPGAKERIAEALGPARTAAMRGWVA